MFIVADLVSLSYLMCYIHYLNQTINADEQSSDKINQILHF